MEKILVWVWGLGFGIDWWGLEWVRVKLGFREGFGWSREIRIKF
jgi:hypothetical protein